MFALSQSSHLGLREFETVMQTQVAGFADLFRIESVRSISLII